MYCYLETDITLEQEFNVIIKTLIHITMTWKKHMLEYSSWNDMLEDLLCDLEKVNEKPRLVYIKETIDEVLKSRREYSDQASAADLSFFDLMEEGLKRMLNIMNVWIEDFEDNLKE